MKFPPSHSQSQIPKPGLKLGFGGAALSGEGGGYGFGAVSEKDAERLLRSAWENGITLFDTAPIYGFGLSEERMGRHLPTEAVIVTKGGVSWHPNKRVNMTNHPQVIESMLLESLKRLKRDCIDIYMIHWPDAQVDIRAPLEVLETYRQKGAIKAIGLCNTHADDLAKAETVTTVEYLQSEFNLFNPSLASLERKEKFCMGWGTFDKGILTGRVHEQRTFEKDDCRSWAPWWNKKVVTEKVRRVAKLKALLDEYSLTLLEFNLQYGIHYADLDCALVGPKSEADLLSLLKAMESPIKTEVFSSVLKEWERLA